MSVDLRLATPDDLSDVVAVFLACWHEGYPEHLPPALVATMTAETAVALWSSVLSRPDRAVVLAVREDVVCGVVGFSTDGSVGDVHSLYVAPSEQGRGTGRALLGRAATDLARSGAAVGRLWVFADNAPALAFYRREGWQPDGGTRVEEQFGEPELRLTRRLAPHRLEVLS
ncbi:MAG: GNAT family N-acetyltransferase [Lapillicoccus sp.]